ncbi:MAG: hypothetical protein QOI92_2144 [Chloroflexota bacterium]|jgi:hypothetical protein|nr:hypothetical protein [Chloroflexota bacterium]
MTRSIDTEARLRAWPAVVVGIAGVVALALIRVLILADAAPSGIDGGNWLAFGTVERLGVAYPPVVPFLFSHLIGLVGAPAATSIAAATAISLPAIAILLLATWAGQPIAGVFSGLFVAGSPTLGEAVAWGGYPQPIATAAATIALVALVVYMDRGRRSALAAFGVAFAVVVGTSHLVAVPVVAAAALIVATRLSRSVAVLRRVLLAMVVAGIPVALLAGTYLALFATLGLPSAGSEDIARILGPQWIAYPAALIVVMTIALLVRVGPLPPMEPRQRALLVAAAAAATAWGAAFLASGESRLLYDLPTIAPLAVVALAPVAIPLLTTRRLQLAVGAGLLVLCVGFVSSGLTAFPGQVAFYRVMTAGDLAAMQWLADQPIAADQVLVADRGGVPLGWWAEGLTGRETLYASELRWLRFDTERQRTRTANVLLYQSGFPDPSSAAAITNAGIHYVLLPYASAFDVDQRGPAPGWRIAFAAGDAVVMAPDPSTALTSAP